MATPTSTGTTAKSAAPRRPAGTTTSGAAAKGEVRQNSLEKHLAIVAEGAVMTPGELYSFLEALRALTSGLAFFVHAGASQLEAAARKGAREATDDGRLTLDQKIKLQRVLRRMGKAMDNGAAEDLLAAATSAIKTYSLMEAFLEELESTTVQRPHRSARGGFSLGGS